MDIDQREERLRSDYELLKALRQHSSIFTFEATGTPPDRYTLSFRGTGLSRSRAARTGVEKIELHNIDLRLPYAYPRLPPDLRWVTPIFHPNVSFSGFIHLRDVGIPWDSAITLDAVCERLWDVSRMAYVNLDKATNYSAKSWLEEQTDIQLPVDARPLQDKRPGGGPNVVKYRRRGGSGKLDATPSGNEVFYIGEDTPTPTLPTRQHAPQGRDDDNDEDVLFIGDE